MSPATTTKQAMDKQLVRQQIERLFAAYNEHDVAKVLAFFTDDVVWTQPLEGTVNGRAEAEKVLLAMRGTMPDLHFPIEDVQIFVADDGKLAASTYRMTGAMTGRADPPGYEPTGKTATVRGACLYEMRGDLIARHTVIYDGVDLLQQLGLMPATNSLPSKLIAGAQTVTSKVTHVLHR